MVEGQASEARIMRIGELAAETGVSASRIRYYETAGLLAPDARTPTGYRIYGESAAQALRLIEQAQTAGFTLAEIKGLLATNESGEWNREVLLTALRRKLAAIAALREQLTRAELGLRAVIDDIETSPVDLSCADNAQRVIANLL